MKLNINNNNNFNANYSGRYNSARIKAYESTIHKGIGKENEAVNTNVNNNRPAEAISFGGSLSSVSTKAVNNLVNSKNFNNFVKYAADNEVIFTALYSLVLAGILKPYFIIKQKGGDEKDKQYIATKNFLQAFVGSFLNLTVGGMLIDKMTKGAKRELSFLKEEKDANGQITNFNLKQDIGSYTEEAISEIQKKKNSLGGKLKRGFTSLRNGESFKKGFQDVTNIELTATDKKVLERLFKLKGKENIIDEANKLLAHGESLSKAGKTTIRMYRDANNHLSIFQNNKDFIKTLHDTSIKKGLLGNNSHPLKSGEETPLEVFSSVMKNSSGVFTGIIKGMISSRLLPIVTTLIFGGALASKLSGKKDKKQTEENKPFVTIELNNSEFISKLLLLLRLF